jgi:Crp-like helix-turn-helix domain
LRSSAGLLKLDPGRRALGHKRTASSKIYKDIPAVIVTSSARLNIYFNSNGGIGYQCPLVGVKWTWRLRCEMSVPKRTWHEDSRCEGWQRQWPFWTLPSSQLFPLHADAELYRHRRVTDQRANSGHVAMVLFIKRSALFSIATRECRVANFLLATTTTELRRAQEHALLMSKDAKCGLATFLTDFWERMGKPNCPDFPMSHQDVADHLGLTIETPSRTITNLERLGIILRTPPRNSLLLPNPSLLACMTN